MSGVPLIESLSQSDPAERLDTEHGDQAPTCKKNDGLQPQAAPQSAYPGP